MPFTSTDDEKILQYLGLDGERSALSNVQSRMFAVRSLGEPVIKACQDSLSKIEAIDKALTDAVKTPKSISSEDFEELRKEGRRACNWLANILGLDVGADYFGSFEAGQLALIPNSAKGVANGVATLDSSGLIPLIQVPPIDGLWGTINGELSDQTDLQDALDARATNLALSAHTTATNNPHQVTLAQIGGPIIQQAQPSNPTDGMRWLEVDGSGFPVEEWYWDSTVNGGSWLSVRLFTLSSLASISGSQSFAFAQPTYITSGIFIPKAFFALRTQVAYSPGGAVDSNTTYFHNLGLQAEASASQVFLGAFSPVFSTQGTTRAQWDRWHYIATPNQVVLTSSTYRGIGAAWTKVGAASMTHDVSLAITYRLIR